MPARASCQPKQLATDDGSFKPLTPNTIYMNTNEILITHIFDNQEPDFFASSIAKSGNPNIARDCWLRAVTHADPLRFLVTPAQQKAFQDYLEDAGFEFEREYTPREIEALFIQSVASDVEEAQYVAPGRDWQGISWKKYERASNDGKVSGTLFKGEDGEIYYQIG